MYDLDTYLNNSADAIEHLKMHVRVFGVRRTSNIYGLSTNTRNNAIFGKNIRGDTIDKILDIYLKEKYQKS